MQSQNDATVVADSREERKRLRGKMPKGFNVQISKELEIDPTTVCKWFRNDFNSERIFKKVKTLAGE